MNSYRNEEGGARIVRATFDSPDRLQHAAARLLTSGFDRADLTLPAHGHEPDEPNPDTATRPVNTDDDAQQARTLGTSTAAAAAALAASGVVIATGGAAAPAVAAALLAGGAAGGATFAAMGAGSTAEQQARQDEADSGALVISVRAINPEKTASARAILTEEGGTALQVD